MTSPSGVASAPPPPMSVKAQVKTMSLDQQRVKPKLLACRASKEFAPRPLNAPLHLNLSERRERIWLTQPQPLLLKLSPRESSPGARQSSPSPSLRPASSASSPSETCSTDESASEAYSSRAQTTAPPTAPPTAPMTAPMTAPPTAPMTTHHLPTRDLPSRRRRRASNLDRQDEEFDLEILTGKLRELGGENSSAVSPWTPKRRRTATGRTAARSPLRERSAAHTGSAAETAAAGASAELGAAAVHKGDDRGLDSAPSALESAERPPLLPPPLSRSASKKRKVGEHISNVEASLHRLQLRGSGAAT